MSKPKNPREVALWEQLVADGYEVFRNGYPDIMARKDGKIIAIEVKATANQSLRQDQLDMMELLMSLGVPCFKWSPDSKLIRIAPSQSILELRKTLTLQQIADLLGISISKVWSLEKKAKKE